jgi:hypothetical protein
MEREDRVTERERERERERRFTFGAHEAIRHTYIYKERQTYRERAGGREGESETERETIYLWCT